MLPTICSSGYKQDYFSAVWSASLEYLDLNITTTPSQHCALQVRGFKVKLKHVLTGRQSRWNSSMTVRAGLVLKQVAVLQFVAIIIMMTATGHVAAAENSSSLLIDLRIESPVSNSTRLTANNGTSELSSVKPTRTTARLVRQRRIDSPARYQRNIQYSEDQLVVVSLDANGLERYRDVHNDPRLIRAELADGDGRLESRLLFRSSASFSFAIPDDPETDSVKILKPRWNGGEFAFDTIATLPIQ